MSETSHQTEVALLNRCTEALKNVEPARLDDDCPVDVRASRLLAVALGRPSEVLQTLVETLLSLERTRKRSLVEVAADEVAAASREHPAGWVHLWLPHLPSSALAMARRVEHLADVAVLLLRSQAHPGGGSAATAAFVEGANVAVTLALEISLSDEEKQ